MTHGHHDPDALIRLLGAEIERLDDDLLYQDEALLTWLAQDLREGQARWERERDERDADTFVARMATARRVQRAERALPRRVPGYREPAEIRRVSEAVALARGARCAPVLTLAAAAGVGRDLWDEPAETWLRLPDDIPDGAHIVMGVSGDSMEPVLTPRDVILVRLGTTPVVDDLVVALVPDTGFVVKRVASIAPRWVELASFNAAYDTLRVAREPETLLGTVVGRFHRYIPQR